MNLEETAEQALRRRETEQFTAVPVVPSGDELAMGVVRRSALAGWFAGVAWRLVDHNYPECRRIGVPGMVVVTPQNPPSSRDLHFVLTCPSWDDRPGGRTVSIVHPDTVRQHQAGEVPLWTSRSYRVVSAADVGMWLRGIPTGRDEAA